MPESDSTAVDRQTRADSSTSAPLSDECLELRERDFAALLDRVQGFWGQEVYAGLGPAIAKKKWFMRLAFVLVASLVRGRLLNYLAVAAVVLFYPHFRQPDSSAIFQYGSSRVNRLAFDRVNTILLDGGISDFSLNGDAVPFRTRLRVATSIGLMFRAARALATNRHRNPFIHCQQIVGCSALLLLDRVLTPSTRLACVANDHFPASIALLDAAKRKGITTCYFQHAPVTHYFPPLDYDLSILFDRASLEAYEHAARKRGSEVAGRVIILPPFEEVLAMPAVGTSPFIAGVCLSLLPNNRTMIELLEKLGREDAVKAIHVRRHPRCGADLSGYSAIPKVSLQPTGQSAAEFFEGVDLVLVPSSGVAIEALHRGLPTFYMPNADELTDDYYGFVSAGILPVFNLAVLSGPNQMTEFFDSEWRRRFGHFDETVNTSPAQARSEVLSAFVKLLS